MFQTDAGYYFGYVYFRQIKDRTIRRGYFQKVFYLFVAAAGVKGLEMYIRP